MKTFHINIQYTTKRTGVSLHVTIAAETRGDAIESALKKNMDPYPARILRGIMVKEVAP